MLEWATKDETHAFVALFLVALTVLLVAGVLDNFLTNTAMQRVKQFAKSLMGPLAYVSVRALLAAGKVLAFFLTGSWFYGALADLAAIAAGVTPVVFYIGTAAQSMVTLPSAAASTALIGQFSAASIPVLTVGQTLGALATCGVGVVMFRGIAAALAKRKK